MQRNRKIITHNEEKNYLTKTDPELTKVLKLANKNVRKLSYCVSIFKKLEKELNLLSREIKI